MYLVYVDESSSPQKAGGGVSYAFLIIHDQKIKETDGKLEIFAQEMYDKHTLIVTPSVYSSSVDYEYWKQYSRFIEIHATELFGGKNKYHSIRQEIRKSIYQEYIDTICKLDIAVILGCTKNVSPNGTDTRLFERCLSEVDKYVGLQPDKNFMLISDKGHEDFVRMQQEYLKKNNIHDSYIIDPPLFANSHESKFIQIADILAYSICKNENPEPNQKKWKKDVLKNAIEEKIAKSILDTRAFKKDKRNLGIVRTY